MKSTIAVFLGLLGVCALVMLQFARLENVSMRLAQNRISMMRLVSRVPSEPRAKSVQNQVDPPPSAKLKKLIASSQKVMGGIPLLHPEQLFEDYPRLEEAFIRAKAGKFRLEYGAFFALAGMSDERINEFIEIKMEGERKWVDAVRVSSPGGLKNGVLNSSRDTDEKSDNQLLQFLNPAEIRLLDRIRDERPARENLTQLLRGTIAEPHPIELEKLNSFISVATKYGLFVEDTLIEDPKLTEEFLKCASLILPQEQLQKVDLLLDAQQAAMVRKLDRRRH